MNTASHYARALFALTEEKPKDGAAYLHNLSQLLKRRKHSALLPRIFAEYRKLELQRDRSQRHRETTPEEERTRILLELYRKLITSA